MTALRVVRPELDLIDTFDEPEILARASEGFCPFPRHFRRDDQIGTTEPVAVIVQADGFIQCPFGKANGRDSTLMRYEWTETDVKA